MIFILFACFIFLLTLQEMVSAGQCSEHQSKCPSCCQGPSHPDPPLSVSH